MGLRRIVGYQDPPGKPKKAGKTLQSAIRLDADAAAVVWATGCAKALNLLLGRKESHDSLNSTADAGHDGRGGCGGFIGGAGAGR